MNSSAKTATTHPLLNLNAASARRIAAAVGKLAGGCIVLITVSYFWALVKDHTPEIDPLFFCIPPLVSVASLAFYLAAEMAKGFGIKVRSNIALASRKICVNRPLALPYPSFHLLCALVRQHQQGHCRNGCRAACFHGNCRNRGN